MPADPLSRRERQILDILFRRHKASAQEVLLELPDQPSYSTVRTLLRILVEKGHAHQQADGNRYLYTPAVAVDSARKTALSHMLSTFFENKPEHAMAALIDTATGTLDADELDRLHKILKKARKEARK